MKPAIVAETGVFSPGLRFGLEGDFFSDGIFEPLSQVCRSHSETLAPTMRQPQTVFSVLFQQLGFRLLAEPADWTHASNTWETQQR